METTTKMSKEEFCKRLWEDRIKEKAAKDKRDFQTYIGYRVHIKEQNRRKSYRKG